MLSTVPHSGKPGRFFVTLLQFFPPSRVTCTCPSLVPTQIRPASLGDSVSAKITPAYSTPMLSGVSPPEICRRRAGHIIGPHLDFAVLVRAFVEARYRTADAARPSARGPHDIVVHGIR